MLNLDSVVSEGLTPLNSRAKQELEYWKHLLFEFDMDRKKSSNTNHPQRQSSGSNADQPENSNIARAISHDEATFLAQFAAAAATIGQPEQPGQPAHSTYPSVSPTPGFYNNFMFQYPVPPPSAQNFPWNIPPHQSSQAGPSHYHLQMSSDTPSFIQHPVNPGTAQIQQPSQATAVGSPTPPEVEQAISEDKRRRNTAASARFRIKKKHKTLGLERSVSDLTGRADELEREAADLRRENGWLKEIVMLKGARYAENNPVHRQALYEASGGLELRPSAPVAGSSSSLRRSSEQPEELSDSEESDSEDQSGAKGKRTAKGERKS